MKTYQSIFIAVFLLSMGLHFTARCENTVPQVTVKVVVHWISDQTYTVPGVASRVNDQITKLNDAFADAHVQFELASGINVVGDYHGIYCITTTVASFTDETSMLHTSSGGHDLLNTRNYLNIYVCNYENPNQDIGYGLIREDRYFPGSSYGEENEDAVDAVVVNMDCFAGGSWSGHLLGKLAIHEVAHWLGLHDLIGTNCDLYHNFMNVVDDPCVTQPFTTLQIDSMRHFINVMRPWLNCINITVNSDQTSSFIRVTCVDLPGDGNAYDLTPGTEFYWPIDYMNASNQKVGVYRTLDARTITGTTFDRALDNWTGNFISNNDPSNPLPATPTTGGTGGSYTSHYHTQYNVNLTAAQNIDGGSVGTYDITRNGTPINSQSTYAGIFVPNLTSPMTLHYTSSTTGIFESWSDGYQGATYSNFVPTQHTWLHAIEKSHLLSATQDALQGSNQRKMVTDGSTTYAVYQDGDYIFFTKNTGSGWSNEIMLSSMARNTVASDPSIARLNDGSLHVVWDEADANDAYHHVCYTYSSNGGNNWYPSFKLKDANIFTMYGSTAPVIRGTTMPVVVWSRSGAYSSPTGSGFEVLGNPANNVATAASYLNNTSSAANPSLDCMSSTWMVAYQTAGGDIKLESFTLDEIGYLNYQLTTPFNVSTGYSDCSEPSLVVDGSKCYVAFAANDGQYACFRQNNGTSWQTIKQFTHSDPVNGAHICAQPSIGIESNGTNSNITLVWQCCDQALNPLHISKVVFPIGASDWGPIIDLGSGNNPTISGYTTASNHPWIGWSELASPSTVHLFQDAVPPAPPATVSSPDNVTGLSITLTWSAVYNAEAYTIHFVPPAGVSMQDITNITGTTLTVTLPAHGYGTYTCQVKAVNYIGSSSLYTQRTFTAWAVDQPVLTSPANLALLQGNSVTLTWNTVAGATAYHVQVRPYDINNGYGEYIFNSDITGTSLSLSGLIWSTTSLSTSYEWSVYAKNSYGIGRTNQRSFITPLQPPHMQSISSTALTTNSQRKLARGSSGNLYLTYENGGNIFYTFSTDNGATWSTEVYVNDPNTQGNSYPAITERSGNVYIVWQHDNGSSNWFVVYRVISDGSSVPQILTNTNCPSPGPLPVILAGAPANSFEGSVSV
jgi:hypothetical protein